MQLNITTDYAIRAVLVLAAEQRKMTAEEISTQMSIPLNYLKKISGKLIKKGLLKAQRGIYGGFLLGRDAAEITIYDIVSTMEPTMAVNRCVEEDCYCNRKAVSDCPVRSMYKDIQESLERELKRHTVKDMIGKIEEMRGVEHEQKRIGAGNCDEIGNNAKLFKEGIGYCN